MQSEKSLTEGTVYILHYYYIYIYIYETCIFSDNFQLNQIIKNLHDILHKRCNLESTLVNTIIITIL